MARVASLRNVTSLAKETMRSRSAPGCRFDCALPCPPERRARPAETRVFFMASDCRIIGAMRGYKNATRIASEKRKCRKPFRARGIEVLYRGNAALDWECAPVVAFRTTRTAPVAQVLPDGVSRGDLRILPGASSTQFNEKPRVSRTHRGTTRATSCRDRGICSQVSRRMAAADAAA